MPALPLFSRAGLRAAASSLAVQILVLFLFTTLGALVVGVLQTRDDERAAEERALEDARSAADSAATSIEGTLQFARQAAQAIEELPTFWDGSDAARDEILTVLADAQPIVSALNYFTADFRGHGRSHYDPAVGRPDY